MDRYDAALEGYELCVRVQELLESGEYDLRDVLELVREARDLFDYLCPSL